MPRLSTYFVKSSLICLALGFTIGGLILASKATTSVTGMVWLWFPAHIVLLMNGWLIQLTMGVAYWILPRIQGSDRGRGRWAWASFWTMESGLALVILSLLNMWWTGMGELFAPGVGLQAISIALFVIHGWPRVRASFARTTTIQAD
jgi:hypothetical protein